MFDRTDDPDYLRARLEAFITHWHGYRRSWFGVACRPDGSRRSCGPACRAKGMSVQHKYERSSCPVRQSGDGIVYSCVTAPAIVTMRSSGLSARTGAVVTC